jgi:hypothetical protein
MNDASIIRQGIFMPSAKVTVSMRLDPYTYEEARKRAFKQNASMQVLLAEALREYLEKRKEGKAA